MRAPRKKMQAKISVPPPFVDSITIRPKNPVGPLTPRNPWVIEVALRERGPCVLQHTVTTTGGVPSTSHIIVSPLAGENGAPVAHYFRALRSDEVRSLQSSGKVEVTLRDLYDNTIAACAAPTLNESMRVAVSVFLVLTVGAGTAAQRAFIHHTSTSTPKRPGAESAKARPAPRSRSRTRSTAR